MLYLICLTVANIFLLASGIGMCFLGIHFNFSYHMTRLGFISKWLRIFPYTLIGLGAGTAVISVLGIFCITNRNRIGLRIYTILVALLVLPQFFTTYQTSLLNSENARDNMFESQYVKLRDHLLDATKKNDTATLDDWHYIESDLRCCGDIDMKGYRCKCHTQTSSIIV